MTGAWPLCIGWKQSVQSVASSKKSAPIRMERRRGGGCITARTRRRSRPSFLLAICAVPGR